MTVTSIRSEPIMALHKVGVAYRKRHGLIKHRRVWALKEVTFDLFQGESLGIIGRNGVGKSTLLRLLAGIIAPDRGRIIAPGVRAALLSLSTGFDQRLTGRENAMLSGLLLGLSRETVRSNMNSIIEFAGLEDEADEPVGTYSSGMKARLGFSVAIMADPDVLLVDEVLGVGDIEFREKSAHIIRERINSDRTVVLVSHNTKVIEQNCDRAVWIEKGVVMEEGVTTAVLNRYLGSRSKAKAVHAAQRSRTTDELNLPERGKLHRAQ